MYLCQLLKTEVYFKMPILRIFLIFISLNAFSDTLYNFTEESQEIRFNNLIKDIRCPKCTSGSLSSSNAPISEDLKLKIVDMIKENKTDQEIKEYVASRFGKESLYEPDFNKSTYFLWFSPFILLFLALTFFLFRSK
tara:strand:- start:1033 stop:1443 length:411 start_codon:yes stop_codon:yes gene_type:complete